MNNVSLDSTSDAAGEPQLSEAGRARRDAMLPLLEAELQHVQIRRSRRRQSAATIVGAAVFALLGVAALQWVAPETIAPSSSTSSSPSPSVAASGSNGLVDPDAGRPASANRPAISIVTTPMTRPDDRRIVRTPGASRAQIITTDAAAVRDLIVSRPATRVAIISDDELVEHLADAGYPAALIRIAGTARIEPIGWRAADADRLAPPGG